MGNVDGTFDIRTVNVCQRLDYKKDKVWKMDTVCFILISKQKVEEIANFHVLRIFEFLLHISVIQFSYRDYLRALKIISS